MHLDPMVECITQSSTFSTISHPVTCQRKLDFASLYFWHSLNLSMYTVR